MHDNLSSNRITQKYPSEKREFFPFLCVFTYQRRSDTMKVEFPFSRQSHFRTISPGYFIGKKLPRIEEKKLNFFSAYTIQNQNQNHFFYSLHWSQVSREAKKCLSTHLEGRHIFLQNGWLKHGDIQTSFDKSSSSQYDWYSTFSAQLRCRSISFNCLIG